MEEPSNINQPAGLNIDKETENMLQDQTNPEKIFDYYMPMYLDEIYLNCFFIKKNAEKVFSNFDENFTGIIVQSELTYYSSSILIDAAKLYNLIKNTRKYDKRYETKSQYNIRLKRNNYIASILQGINLDPLTENNSRNSIEHIDEYIDQTIDFILTQKNKKYHVPQNISSTSEYILDQFFPNSISRPIRMYISSTKEFVHCGKKTNIGKIYECACDILSRITAHGASDSGTIYK